MALGQSYLGQSYLGASAAPTILTTNGNVAIGLTVAATFITKITTTGDGFVATLTESTSGVIVKDVATGNVAVSLTEAFSPEAVGVPGNVAVSLTETFSPEGLGEHGNVAVSLTEALSPESVGAPGNVVVTLSEASTLALALPSANDAVTLTMTSGAYISGQAAGNVAVSLLEALSPEAIGVPGAVSLTLVENATLTLTLPSANVATTLLEATSGVVIKQTATGNVALTMLESTSGVIIRDIASGNVAVTMTETFSPEGLGEKGNVAVSLVEAFSPEAVGAPGGVTISLVEASTLSLKLPSANVSVTLTEAVTATIKDVATGGVSVSLTEGFAPEGLGESGNVSVTFAESMTLLVRASATGNAVLTFTDSGTAAIVLPPVAGNITTTLVEFVAAASLHIRVPTSQPGPIMPFVLIANNQKIWGPAIGPPSNGLGRNGDFYSRTDGVAGTSLMYFKSAGAWADVA